MLHIHVNGLFNCNEKNWIKKIVEINIPLNNSSERLFKILKRWKQITNDVTTYNFIFVL